MGEFAALRVHEGPHCNIPLKATEGLPVPSRCARLGAIEAGQGSREGMAAGGANRSVLVQRLGEAGQVSGQCPWELAVGGALDWR